MLCAGCVSRTGGNEYGGPVHRSSEKTPQEEARSKEYMEENYENRILLCGYDTTRDTDPHHAMYALANGLKVREVVIDSGTSGDAVNIVQFGDIHLNYCNEQDFEEANPAVMSTWEHRKWNQNGESTPQLERAMEYASFYDKTVITGDVMDYLSYGNIELMQKLILSKDPNVSIAMGNHEITRVMEGTVSDPSSLQSRYEILAKVWPHDVKYYSEILADSQGNEKVMIVVLDNQSYQYWKEQIEPFQADIAAARKKKIPILIFEHVTLCTRNPADTEFGYFYEPGDTSWMPYDLSKEGAGGEGANQNTKEMYALITENADVIKGVFNGDWHNNAYSEILAKTPDGKDTIIPQYTVTANAFHDGCVIRITVK